MSRPAGVHRPITLDYFKSLCELKQGDELDTPCWVWRGCVNSSGAPIMGAFSKTYPARRVGWAVQTGEWPKWKLYATCKNRLCCNPWHMVDVSIKKIPKLQSKNGQMSCGMRHSLRQRAKPPRSVMTWEKVREFRRRRHTESVPELAKEYGLSHAAAYKIARNETWREGILA